MGIIQKIWQGFKNLLGRLTKPWRKEPSPEIIPAPRPAAVQESAKTTPFGADAPAAVAEKLSSVKNDDAIIAELADVLTKLMDDAPAKAENSTDEQHAEADLEPEKKKETLEELELSVEPEQPPEAESEVAAEAEEEDNYLKLAPETEPEPTFAEINAVAAEPIVDAVATVEIKTDAAVEAAAQPEHTAASEIAELPSSEATIETKTETAEAAQAAEPEKAVLKPVKIKKEKPAEPKRNRIWWVMSGGYKQKLEVLLFMSKDALSIEEMAKYIECSQEDILKYLDELKDFYENSEHGIKIVQVGDKYQFGTKPEYTKTLEDYINAPTEISLSIAAMETLSIIAYRQPITRAEVEAIRGVNSDGIIKSLQDKELIAEAGRAETIGRPTLYTTTELFLKHFGLSSLNDLPPEPKLKMNANPEAEKTLDTFRSGLSAEEAETMDTLEEAAQKNVIEPYEIA